MSSPAIFLQPVQSLARQSLPVNEKSTDLIFELKLCSVQFFGTHTTLRHSRLAHAEPEIVGPGALSV